MSGEDDRVLDSGAQVRAALDLICDCLRDDFAPSPVSEVSLSWVVAHGRYEIRRSGDLTERTERALYYKGAGPAPEPKAEGNG